MPRFHGTEFIVQADYLIWKKKCRLKISDLCRS